MKECPNLERESPWPVVPASGRILAIDYGSKYLGLALSDELRLTAQPLAILTRTNRQNDLRRLRELCRKHHVSRIIVGHPVLLSGTPSEMSQQASRFAVRLAKQLGVSVELVDERLTSWEAEQTARRRARRRRFDDVAAALILRDHLEQRRSQTLPSDPTEAG